jgi:hypothetical protein
MKRPLIKSLNELLIALAIIMVFIGILACAPTRLTKEDRTWLECIQRNGQVPYTWDTYQFENVEFNAEYIYIDSVYYYGGWEGVNKFNVHEITDLTTENVVTDPAVIMIIQTTCESVHVHVAPGLENVGLEIYIKNKKLISR